MQPILTNEGKTRTGAKAADFKKRIGSTTYVVSTHFNRESKETVVDKILKLIENEARNIA